jgi:hypothetical protein
MSGLININDKTKHMTKKRTLITIAFVIAIVFQILTSSQLLHAQFEKKVNTRMVVLTYPDSTLRINILNKDNNLKTQKTKTYYWYYSNKISSNQGGFFGHLLHGDYVVFNDQMNMITQGRFSFGLKEGTWKQWYSNGNLMSIAEYKDGQKEGTSKTFAPDGDLRSVVEYKDGKKHGTETHILGGKTYQKEYKHGEEQKEKNSEPGEKKSIKQKIKQIFKNIFTKTTEKK